MHKLSEEAFELDLMENCRERIFIINQEPEKKTE